MLPLKWLNDEEGSGPEITALGKVIHRGDIPAQGDVLATAR